MVKIIKFYSPFCGPCKVLEKNLQESKIEYINVNVFEDESSLADKYDIRTIPALVKVDSNGDIINKAIGILSVEQIKEFAK